MAITIIGAGGVTGAPLIRALKARGARIRVVSRRTAQPDLFPDGVEVRFGDLLNVESLASAIEGADVIHYIPPSFEPREVDFARNLIRAAERADIRRIVYHSVLHAMTPDMPHHFRKAQVELLLRHSRLDWTILQPAMYAQTALAFFDADAGELTPAFDPTRPFAPVHDRDLAEAAAIVHTTDGHSFATYELAGPELLDFIGMGERLGVVIKRPIATRRVSATALSPRVAAARNFNPDQVREMELMFAHYDAHGLVGNGNVLRMILGRAPTDFAEAMRCSLAKSP